MAFFSQNGSDRIVQVGSTKDSRFAVSVSAAGSTRLSTSDTTPTVISGWASFNSTSTFIRGVATFDLRVNGVLITSASVIGSAANNRFVLPVELAEAASTGIAIVSPLSATNIRLRLFSESGAEISSTLNALAVRSQVADFLQTFFGSVMPPFRGSLVAEVVQGGSIAVTGLTVKEGLLSALPVIDALPPDTGLPSTPMIGVIRGLPEQGPATYVYVVGVDIPGVPYGTPPPSNWNNIQEIQIQISTDSTFATFPAKKGLNQVYGVKPPLRVVFSTNFSDTYYLRARVKNAIGYSPFTPTLTRCLGC